MPVTGQRMTKQKRIILDILRSTSCHPTADWVYEQARKVLPDISLGTVYRNLKVLKEAGEILELAYGSTYSRFDGNSGNHYHFTCRVCGVVLDVEYPVQREMEEAIRQRTGLQVVDHRLELYGYCPNCQTDQEAVEDLHRV